MLRYCFLLSGLMGFAAIGHTQSFESMSYTELEKKIASTTDKTLVINFWATWCRPCVEELPDFEKVNEEYADENVAVWLINLDFNSAVETSVKPFMDKRNIKSYVIHITDTDPNDWAEKVDKDWGGNIPITLIYKAGKKVAFHPSQLTYTELVNLISK
jgi:thiol-disulfide isomerase/thioredoxin